MTEIDRRDVFSYAEAQRLAERERATANAVFWRAARRWVRSRLHREPAVPSRLA